MNCDRALQPTWKYCIYCGTRTTVAAAAPRSRPLPKRTPVPGYASVTTAQTPIVPPPAPAPLSAAPREEPVSAEWPESLGERPSLRSALAATEVPAPTPPREDAPTPEGEEEPAADEQPVEQLPVDDDPIDDEPIDEPSGPRLTIADLAHEPEDEDEDEPAQPEPEAATVAADEPEPLDDPEPQPLPRRGRGSRRASRASAAAVLDERAEAASAVETVPLDDVEIAETGEQPADRTGSVNTLAVLALLIGILACPLSAPFGHIALSQVRRSGERGVIPAWIAVVLGYLWLGFWMVAIITYFATNG